MIITSSHPLEVNKIYNNSNLSGFEICGKTIEHYAFQVIRVASIEEFINEIKILYPSEWIDIVPCGFYYEILAD